MAFRQTGQSPPKGQRLRASKRDWGYGCRRGCPTPLSSGCPEIVNHHARVLQEGMAYVAERVWALGGTILDCYVSTGCKLVFERQPRKRNSSLPGRRVDLPEVHAGYCKCSSVSFDLRTGRLRAWYFTTCLIGLGSSVFRLIYFL